MAHDWKRRIGLRPDKRLGNHREFIRPKRNAAYNSAASQAVLPRAHGVSKRKILMRSAAFWRALLHATFSRLNSNLATQYRYSS